MSIRALRVAFDNVGTVKIGPCAKLVYLALSNRHNQETGRCDPSIERIAEDLGISERSVRMGLRELEGVKLVSTTHRIQRTGRGKRNLTNRYRLKGGAKSAGGMGQDLPPNLNTTRPSAFDDLVVLTEDFE